nr:hypothetical protein [uncultured Rhodopila sp.]
MQPITHSLADSAVAKTRARRAIQAATISDAAGDAPDGQQLAATEANPPIIDRDGRKHAVKSLTESEDGSLLGIVDIDGIPCTFKALRFSTSDGETIVGSNPMGLREIPRHPGGVRWRQVPKHAGRSSQNTPT